MIFKPRLFTLLLGLLFAVVLTDQASVLYDPGVGRFCSKAPIGKAESPFDLRETLGGYVVFGTDAYGLKCCLRTYGGPAAGADLTQSLSAPKDTLSLSQ